MNRKIIIGSSIVLILDQLSKIIVGLTLNLNESINVIKNLFNITYIHNYGAAWGILKDKTFLLTIMSIIALIIIYRYSNTFIINRRNKLAFSFLLGGITGNLLDRLFLGYVRDFLDFNIFGYDFPVFNIGDSCIFIGVILLMISIYKKDDYEVKSRRK